MCGIVGILGLDDQSTVESMANRLAHRGPDGSGAWSDRDITLGHRRLAILDPEHGAEPMESHDGRFVITYNGEVYNHPALRRELKAHQAEFRTDNDAETVLEAYRRWGTEVPGHLEGMFAFAIWDSHERTLFVARDPFGIKPFFWTNVAGTVVFASEVKALMAHPDVRPVEHTDRLKERFALEFLTGQGTLWKGIHQLPPGSFALMRPGDPAPEWRPYYQVPTECFQDIEDAARTVRQRLVRSVQEQLLSDVPLGTILSGGLDSNVVAAIHAAASDAPIQTFTIAEGEEVEDFRQARAVAEHLRADHHEWTFDLEAAWREMPAFTFHNENINHTEFFFLPLFKHMQGRVKVALCGQGSDELWGGYSRYRNPVETAHERLGRLRALVPGHQEDLANQVSHTHMSGSALAEWDQMGQLNNFQLRLVDRTSMAHGIEVRVPFLSRPLHAASRAVCWGWKMRGDVEKWILRRACEDLGLRSDMVWRPKVPAGRATSPRTMDQFEARAEALVDKTRWREHPLRKAGLAPVQLLMLDLWREIFIHREGQVGRLALEDLA